MTNSPKAKATISVWGTAQSSETCDPEIITLLLQSLPKSNQNRLTLENYRVRGMQSHVAGILAMMYLEWKGESITIDKAILEKLMKSSLKKALEAGNEELVALYIDHGMEISAEDIGLAVGNVSILNRIVNGNIAPLAALEGLIIHRADQSIIEGQLMRIDDLPQGLTFAIRHKNPSLIDFLLSLGIQPKVSHLQEAIKAGDEEVVSLLLNYDLVLEETFNNPDEWLIYAVEQNRVKVVEILLLQNLPSEEGKLAARTKAYELQNYEILSLFI
jgi:hypothetical protein